MMGKHLSNLNISLIRTSEKISIYAWVEELNYVKKGEKFVALSL